MFLTITNLEQKLKSPGIKLDTLLYKSSELEMIINLSYYDGYFTALVAEKNVDKYEEALNEKVTDITDDHKCDNFKDLSGLGSDADKFPLLVYFGIPVDNPQTLQFLFR